MSAARKLTPSDLGQLKIKLDTSNLVYSHVTQSSVGNGRVIYMTTWNATQTFNQKGQANDRDNDK